jgi:hypothetical protein
MQSRFDPLVFRWLWWVSLARSVDGQQPLPEIPSAEREERGGKRVRKQESRKEGKKNGATGECSIYVCMHVLWYGMIAVYAVVVYALHRGGYPHSRGPPRLWLCRLQPTTKKKKKQRYVHASMYSAGHVARRSRPPTTNCSSKSAASQHRSLAAS